MEVHRRPQPAPRKLSLPIQTSPDLLSLGSTRDPKETGGQVRGEKEKGSGDKAHSCYEEDIEESDINVYVESPTEESETDGRLSGKETSGGQEGCQGGGSAVEKSLEDEEAAPRMSEEEEAAAKERAAQRQQLAIEELVQTERNYLRMLQLCTVTIRSNLMKMQPPLANLSAMFQFIDEVIDVSAQLLSLLDQTKIQPGEPQYLKTLCDSFLTLSEDIEAAYKEYLANYSNVTAVENAYKQKEAVWSEIVKVIKSSAPDLNGSSLTFFLVMPVQRIARYPLLFQTIQKHTDRAHPAYPLLEQTAHTAVALNCHINEYKRFREVADKYKKTENLTIKDKINRITTHSIAKKTARLSQYFKHETGMASKCVDEEFDALECFFFFLENGIMVLLANVEIYLFHLEKFLICKPEDFDMELDGEKPAICYKEIMTAVRQWILPSYEKRVRSLIHKPLCALRDLLNGPRNLIKKRLDKLLDYELIQARTNLNYEEQAVANTYKTINTLLLNELPRFNGMALQMLWSMLGAFSCLHRDLASDMEQLFQSFTQQLPHTSLEPSAFWEWAEVELLEGGRRLESLCRMVEGTLNAPIVQPVLPLLSDAAERNAKFRKHAQTFRSTLGSQAGGLEPLRVALKSRGGSQSPPDLKPLSPASQRRLQQLTQKHGSGKIYKVTSAVVGSRDLDLTLSKGELVAVISEADSRGDKKRWLVDAGGPRGYAPASKLLLYRQATEDPPPSAQPTLPRDLVSQRRHSYTPESQSLRPVTIPCFQVFAAYDFTARGNHEVSLRAGDPIRVLEPHDKRGNPEWSLVESPAGQKGYVPSNYLTVMPATPLPSSLSGQSPFEAYASRR